MKKSKLGLSFNFSEIKNIDRILMFVVLLFISAYGLLSTDKLLWSQNDPFGSCGIYCVMAKNYDELFFNQLFDRYYFQKSFPSLLIHLVMRVFKVDPSSLSINYLLEVFYWLVLFISLIFWFKLSKLCALTLRQKWIGFFGAFVTYGLVKLTPLLQESPDPIAFLLGIAALYYYLEQRVFFLYLVFIIASYCQPQFKYAVILLLLFPLKDQENLVSLIESKTTKTINIGFRFLIMLMLLSLYIYIIYYYFKGIAPVLGFDNTMFNIIPFSIVLQVVFFFYAFKYFKIEKIFTEFVNTVVKLKFVLKVFSIVLLLLINEKIISYYAPGSNLSRNNEVLFLYFSHFFQSVQQPLKSVTSHLMFFGPILYLSVINWKKISEIIETKGIGLVLFTICFLALSVDSESRHLIAFLPFLALFTSLSFSEKSLNSYLMFIFIVLSILYSRFFIEHAFAEPTNDPFLTTWGPWLTVKGYFRQTLAALVTWLVFVVSIKVKDVFRLSKFFYKMQIF